MTPAYASIRFNPFGEAGWLDGWLLGCPSCGKRLVLRAPASFPFLSLPYLTLPYQARILCCFFSWKGLLVRYYYNKQYFYRTISPLNRHTQYTKVLSFRVLVSRQVKQGDRYTCIRPSIARKQGTARSVWMNGWMRCLIRLLACNGVAERHTYILMLKKYVCTPNSYVRG